MDKFVITYRALHKEATFECFKDGKFVVLRKVLSDIGMNDVVIWALGYLHSRSSDEFIVHFNGTPTDFDLLKESLSSVLKSKLYHHKIFENVSDRWEILHSIYLEIQDSPYSISKSQFRNVERYSKAKDIFHFGYLLLEHLLELRPKLEEQVHERSHFTQEHYKMLDASMSWVQKLSEIIYRLLD